MLPQVERRAGVVRASSQTQTVMLLVQLLIRYSSIKTPIDESANENCTVARMGGELKTVQNIEFSPTPSVVQPLVWVV